MHFSTKVFARVAKARENTSNDADVHSSDDSPRSSAGPTSIATAPAHPNNNNGNLSVYVRMCSPFERPGSTFGWNGPFDTVVVVRRTKAKQLRSVMRLSRRFVVLCRAAVVDHTKICTCFCDLWTGLQSCSFLLRCFATVVQLLPQQLWRASVCKLAATLSRQSPVFSVLRGVVRARWLQHQHRAMAAPAVKKTFVDCTKWCQRVGSEGGADWPPL